MRTRPDLMQGAELSKEDRKLLAEIETSGVLAREQKI
jgi:hypothetical protein